MTLQLGENKKVAHKMEQSGGPLMLLPYYDVFRASIGCFSKHDGNLNGDVCSTSVEDHPFS